MAMRFSDLAVGMLMAATVAANVCHTLSSGHSPIRPTASHGHPSRRARLLFAGDVMVHSPQLTAARRNDGTYDFYPQFRYLRQRMRAANLAVVNLETTLSPAPPYTGYPLFRSPIQLAHALRRAGVDVAVTANNHCCDGGKRGVATTLAALEQAGIRHTGSFIDTLRTPSDHPLRVEAGGIRFALLNYTYGTNGMPVPAGSTVNRIDTAVISRDLATIDRTRIDCIIVMLHWGNEYQRQPDRAQRQLAASLRRQGADLVIGSHPHVVQPFEADSTGAVFYSLGNLVSNQRQRYCDGGILAEVTVSERYDAAGAPYLHFESQATPVWVALPGYRILPPEVGDTLRMTLESRAAYDRFMTDTRRLLDAGVADRH